MPTPYKTAPHKVIPRNKYGYTAPNWKKLTAAKRKAVISAYDKKHPAKPKLSKLSAAELAVKEIYPNEQSPYKAIPASRQGPGKLTGGYYVTLSCWTVSLQVSVMLGDAGAKITGGGPQWDSIPVPRDAPISIWNGRGLYTMDIDLMFDGWGSMAGHRRNTQTSVEADLSKLEAMANRIPGSLTPPVLRLFGAVPKPGVRWVITGLDYGDALRSFQSGQRLRQSVTVHLSEYREASTLNALKGPAKVVPPRTYKIKKGDTLKKIATKMLHKESAWQQIIKLNPKLKPALRGWKLGARYVGKTILIPAATKTTGKAPGKATPKSTTGAKVTGK